MGGRLIVFEGVEGCGKTTQLQRTWEWLQGGARNVVVTREPGGTELGLCLRKLLLTKSEGKPIQDGAELLLYAADRAQHVEEVLNPMLAQGAIICAIATLIPPLPTRVMVGVLAKYNYRCSTPLPPEDWKAT
jgi:dTMP kinase